MKKLNKTPFAIAIGATLLPMTANIAQADNNPFALSELSAGYMQTAEASQDAGSKMKDGTCGEGKCGGAMLQKSTDKKATEGKCAGNKPTAAPATNDKAADGKKMEGNCGANMK